MRATVVGCWIGLLGAAMPVGAGGEIFGTIETTRGEIFVGPIRWDTNENFWDDMLDATKQEARVESEGFRLSIFGLKIGGHQSAIRNSLSVPFGHLRSIEKLGNDEALLVLKNGERIEARGSTSDLGPRLKVVIDDREQGRVDLRWGSIGVVEFRQGPGSGRDRERLYATVHTRADDFEGFLVWDRDESLVSDVLDGEDEAGEDRKIAFGEIRQIERLGPDRSRVTLKDGGALELHGTNDVDDDNRGLVLALAGVGHVEIEWSGVTKVVFRDPPASPRYEAFDGGRRLSGTVRTSQGTTFSGLITWDRDEAYTWESLDGGSEGIDYAVRLEYIAAIRRIDGASSEIELRDGRQLVLSGTNDVDDDNRGLVVVSNDQETPVEVEWSGIERVDFD